jgi:homoserine acetyltransferase
MKEAGVPVTHMIIATPNGHDAFLVEYDLIVPPVRAFLTT